MGGMCFLTSWVASEKSSWSSDVPTAERVVIELYVQGMAIHLGKFKI